MSEPTNDDGWIVHTGGPCPVPADATVSVRFPGGTIAAGETAGYWAGSDLSCMDWWRWQDEDPAHNIVAYKVLRIPEPDPRDARIAELTAERDALTKRLAETEAAYRSVVNHNSKMATEWSALVRERDKFRALDKQAATHVESLICLRSEHFTGEGEYVGWRGLGLALRRDYDKLAAVTAERDALAAQVAMLREALDHPTLRALFGDIEDSGTSEAAALWSHCMTWFDVRDTALASSGPHAVPLIVEE